MKLAIIITGDIRPCFVTDLLIDYFKGYDVYCGSYIKHKKIIDKIGKSILIDENIDIRLPKGIVIENMQQNMLQWLHLDNVIKKFKKELMCYDIILKTRFDYFIENNNFLNTINVKPNILYNDSDKIFYADNLTFIKLFNNYYNELKDYNYNNDINNKSFEKSWKSEYSLKLHLIKNKVLNNNLIFSKGKIIRGLYNKTIGDGNKKLYSENKLLGKFSSVNNNLKKKHIEFRKYFKDVTLVSQTSLMAHLSTSYLINKPWNTEFDNNVNYEIMFARPDHYEKRKWLDYMPKKTPFVLCIGLSDKSVTLDMLNDLKTLNNFKGMLAQNITFIDKMAIPFPIGFKCGSTRHYQTIINEPEKISLGAKKQQMIIYDIYKKAPKIRKMLCYINFTPTYTDRKKAILEIPEELCYFEKNKISIEETYINQSHYAYVISPHGNGLDCYRTWEAIHLGCIPIVKKSSLSEAGLYDDLPVLIVHEWKHITKELLDEYYLKLSNMFKSPLPKLTIIYWKNKIDNLLKI